MVYVLWYRYLGSKEANNNIHNRYKNFKCTAHNKFFELNLYEKNPVNTHHWRGNISRPSADINLATTQVYNTGSSGLPPPRFNDCGRVTTKSLPKDNKIKAYEEDMKWQFATRQNSFNDHREFDSSPGEDFAACSLAACGKCGY